MLRYGRSSLRTARQNPAPATPPAPVDEQALLRLQLRVFALTWLCYASYYFTRKNLSVVKSRLH